MGAKLGANEAITPEGGHFDDLSQARVYFEAEAVLAIIAKCKIGDWRLVSSNIINLELAKSSDMAKLSRVNELYSTAVDHIQLTTQAAELARTFESGGLKPFDSLHLALAETASVDVFLTVDDKLLRTAKTLPLRIIAANPAAWLTEVFA